MNPAAPKSKTPSSGKRRDDRRALAALLAFALGILVFRAGAAPAEKEADEQFFKSKVEPLLVARCYECHSHGKKIKGGLTLDSRSGWEKGGKNGPVVSLGAPEKSRLITAV